MRNFLLGACMLASAASALFFLRFWRRTHDRLFLIFALAFFVLSANRIAQAFVPAGTEARTLIYCVRLAAFVLILVAIFDKNRDKNRDKDSLGDGRP